MKSNISDVSNAIGMLKSRTDDHTDWDECVRVSIEALEFYKKALQNENSFELLNSLNPGEKFIRIDGKQIFIKTDLVYFDGRCGCLKIHTGELSFLSAETEVRIINI